MQKNQRKSYPEFRYSQINPVGFARMEKKKIKKEKERIQVMS